MYALFGMKESKSRIYIDGRLHGQNTIVERQLRMIHIASSIGNRPYGEAHKAKQLRYDGQPHGRIGTHDRRLAQVHHDANSIRVERNPDRGVNWSSDESLVIIGNIERTECRRRAALLPKSANYINPTAT